MRVNILIFVLAFFVAAGTPTYAANYVLGVHPDDSEFFAFQTSLISLAVSMSDGENSFRVEEHNMAPHEVLHEFAAGGTPFNLIIAGYNIKHEARLSQVYFPLTRGLLGKRVLAIAKGQQSRFDGITTREELTARLLFGSHARWTDTIILRHSDFKIVSAEVDTLWQMVSDGRIHAFPRAVAEIETELKNYTLRTGNLDVVVEKGLLISYPFDYFAYMPRRDSQLAASLQQGFQRAFEAGKIQTLFDSFLKASVKAGGVSLSDRTVIHIENPEMSSRMLSIPETYWYQPTD